MECKGGGRVDGVWYNQHELTHEIEYEGKVIAIINKENDVWQFYFREERKLVDLNEGWHYCSIGWSGLLMENKNTGETRRWTTKLKRDVK